MIDIFKANIYSVYDTDKKKLIKRGTKRELEKALGFSYTEIENFVKGSSNISGIKRYCERTKCNITIRKK